ncbi:unnamed protein product [Amoebophrya sp. A25]|nr:unnamed protein product [Amoebophrya sp. A25]|eukprot:GSA25T00008911001.1
MICRALTTTCKGTSDARDCRVGLPGASDPYARAEPMPKTTSNPLTPSTSSEALLHTLVRPPPSALLRDHVEEIKPLLIPFSTNDEDHTNRDHTIVHPTNLENEDLIADPLEETVFLVSATDRGEEEEEHPLVVHPGLQDEKRQEERRGESTLRITSSQRRNKMGMRKK